MSRTGIEIRSWASMSGGQYSSEARYRLCVRTHCSAASACFSTRDYKLEAEMEKQQAQQKHSSGIVASSELVLQLLFALGLHFNRTSDFAIHAPDHPRDRE